MSTCLKGKSEVKKGEAKYECKNCGAQTNDKDHVCKPKKVKKHEGGKKKKKKKKKKKGKCRKGEVRA